MSEQIRVTNERHWYRNGEIYKVIEVDGRTGGVDEDGDRYYCVNHPKNTDGTKRIVYRDDCEPVTLHNGTYYREVSRKAREGELVKITDNKSGGHPEGYVDTVKHRDDITADDTGVYLTQGYSHGDDEYVVLEPVASDEAAPHTTADLIANLATRLTKLEKRATQTETNIAFLDDGNEIASLQKQVDEIRDNLRTFAETAEGAKVKADEALAGVEVSDRSVKWAHHRISSAEKAAKDTDWKAEMALDDIVRLDERTQPENTGGIFAEEHGDCFADFDALQTSILRATKVPLGDRLELVKQREDQRRGAFDAAANPEEVFE
jgi:uncharacterized coiled-coil protein SlyX